MRLQRAGHYKDVSKSVGLGMATAKCPMIIMHSILTNTPNLDLFYRLRKRPCDCNLPYG